MPPRTGCGSPARSWRAPRPGWTPAGLDQLAGHRPAVRTLTTNSRAGGRRSVRRVSDADEHRGDRPLGVSGPFPSPSRPRSSTGPAATPRGRTAGPQGPPCPPGMTIGPPDFVGVGVPKAGTSWWFSLILAHPGRPRPASEGAALLQPHLLRARAQPAVSSDDDLPGLPPVVPATGRDHDRRMDALLSLLLPPPAHPPPGGT